MTGRGAAAAAFGAGLLFGVGLPLAGMTQPEKVMAFLDVFGRWDPSLVFVMGAAVLVHLPILAWWKRRHPSAGAPAPIDARLVAGAAIFGVGWGLGGYCPGPALVALAGGGIEPGLFVLTMLLGMALASIGPRRAP